MSAAASKPVQVFQGPLILVNRDHPLNAPTAAALAAVGGGRRGVLLERRAERQLAACLCRCGGRGEIVPVSGWRSREEQQAIWDETLEREGADFTRRYVAPPGCSEHETGLAVDLARAAEKIDFIRPDFPQGGVCGAFRRMAAAHGWIERYRSGKEHLTGIAPEPWHFRYVGVPHARLMEQNGLCLEEYAAFLRQGPQVCALPGGRRARVWWTPWSGEGTPPPEGAVQVSGDNAGGFIVTAWEEAP